MSDITLNKDQLNAMDIEDAMELGFDDFETAVEFKTPPRGYYNFAGRKVEEIEMGDLKGWRFLIEVVDTVQLVDENDEQVKPGSQFSISFSQGMLPHLKLTFGAVIKAKEYKNVREFLNDFENLEFSGMLEHNYGKSENPKTGKMVRDKSIVFPQLKEAVLI